MFSTHKGVMTSNDVREECLVCHMTSKTSKENDTSQWWQLGVNKPDQTEPVGCYENLVISKFAQVCK